MTSKKIRRISPADLLFIQFEYCKERFGRDLNSAEGAHLLLAFFLLFEQFLLPGDISSVALGKNILSHCFDSFSCNDFASDRRLYGDLKELPRDVFFQLLAQLSRSGICFVAMRDEA